MAAERSTLSTFLINALIVVVVAGLVAGVAAWFWGRRAARTYTLTYRLAREAADSPPGPGAAEEAARIMAERAERLGGKLNIFGVVARAAGPGAVRLQLRSRRTPEEVDQALAWLTMPGQVEFRLLHPRPDVLETTKPEQLPAEYEVLDYTSLHYILSRPGEIEPHAHPYAVEREPVLRVRELTDARLETSGWAKTVTLTFCFGPEDAGRLATLTALHAGREMAMLVDGRMILPPNQIEGPATGGALQAEGLFFLPVMRKFIACLDAGTMPAPLVEQERTVGR